MTNPTLDLIQHLSFYFIIGAGVLTATIYAVSSHYAKASNKYAGKTQARAGDVQSIIQPFAVIIGLVVVPTALMMALAGKIATASFVPPF